METLQEYCLIALDVFRKFPYPKDRNEQTAWLSFLSTEDVAEADRLILEYPWLEEIYREAASLRQNPEEVFGMYSEALRILDRNTVRYMIEEQKKEIEEQKKKILENQAVIQQNVLEIREKEVEIQEKDAVIEEKETALEQQRLENQELRQELDRLRQKMASIQTSQ